jgi:hypothetical protein
MPTSGTIGQTTISTDKIIEHAIRRCGLSPSSQTVETIQIAKDNLYLILLSITNEGVNLWLIQHSLLGLKNMQATFALPVGSIDLLNVLYSTPSLITGTDSNTATEFTTELVGETLIENIGVKFSSISSIETVFLEHSTDGAVWTTILSDTRSDWENNVNYWFKIDPLIADVFFRVRTLNNITVSTFKLSTSTYDFPIYPYNRDDYLAQSNKFVSGRPSTNYYFEKKLSPQVTLWPIPNNEDDFLKITTQRQIQDVGTLSQEVEVPERWKEAIIWQLSDRLAFELPNVSPERSGLIAARLREQMVLVNMGETDASPLRISPAIGAYTR